MKWKAYWNKVATEATSRFEAVQRTDMQSIEITAAHIIKSLDITKDDTLLDLCCGNGLLTEIIAQNCHSIVGVDQSEILINDANRNSTNANASYRINDVLQVSKVLKSNSFDKIYLQFSFQYCDSKKMGEEVIKEALRLLKPKGKMFIGDIPDKKKRTVFYNTVPKRFYFITSKIRGKNPMGKFWGHKELLDICNKLKVKGTFLEQAQNLPYAWYRFDLLIEKTNEL